MGCSHKRRKREKVSANTFDFIDVRDYHLTTFMARVQYVWIYLIMAKNVLVCVADIYTAVNLLTRKTWSNRIYETCNSSSANCPLVINFQVGKWIFTGCIIFSFLLLGYETYKARRIIASRDIAFAYTNVMANYYYSVKSYNHFCFFSHIDDSKKKKDEFAFFIFFTFKEWKRVLIADGPRQVINALTLYSFGSSQNWSTTINDYTQGSVFTEGLLMTMIFTVVVFAGSLFLLITAAILYIPLLCYIRGNLKEYCCHLIDKRITELLALKKTRRIEQAKRDAMSEAQGDFRHLKGAMPVAQPTLPSIDLADEEFSSKVPVDQNSGRTLDYINENQYYDQNYKPDLQTMPSYNTTGYGYPPHTQNQTGYHQNSSSQDFDNSSIHSSTGLVGMAAAPAGRSEYSYQPYYQQSQLQSEVSVRTPYAAPSYQSYERSLTSTSLASQQMSSNYVPGNTGVPHPPALKSFNSGSPWEYDDAVVHSGSYESSSQTSPNVHRRNRSETGRNGYA